MPIRRLCLSLSAVFVIAAQALSADHVKTPFKGWDDSLELSNGFLKLQVVPSLGKVMGFSTPGLESVIWCNPAIEGLSLKEASSREPIFGWANFGGDRFWVVQQSDNFQVRDGKSWPADETFDGKPWTCSMDKDGVLQMESGTSPECGVKAWRSFDMNVSPELLLIRQRIKAMDGDFMRPLNMIQNVSSVRRPDMVIAKLSPDSHFKYSPLLKSPIPNGVGSSTFPKDANLDKFMAVEGGFAFLSLPSTDFTGKFFADVSSGWICAIYGDQAFFQLFKYQPRQYYPDGGCSVEVYVSPYYFELELLSPARTLKPGEEISFDIAWGVTKLKDAKANRLKLAAECEALAATMLNKCHFNGVELK